LPNLAYLIKKLATLQLAEENPEKLTTASFSVLKESLSPTPDPKASLLVVAEGVDRELKGWRVHIDKFRAVLLQKASSN